MNISGGLRRNFWWVTRILYSRCWPINVGRSSRDLPSIVILELADLDVILPYIEYCLFETVNGQLNFSSSWVSFKFLLNHLGSSTYHTICFCSWANGGSNQGSNIDHERSTCINSCCPHWYKRIHTSYDIYQLMDPPLAIGTKISIMISDYLFVKTQKLKGSFHRHQCMTSRRNSGRI